MFDKVVKYKDFNGVEHTEKLYFHIMTPELADLEFNLEFEGSMAQFVMDAMRSEDKRKLFIFFKMIVVNSYGRRSEDGSEFIKRPEFTEKFLNSPAWEAFFEWLLLDDPSGKNAEQFWLKVMPERITKDGEAVIEGEAKKLGIEKAIKDLSHEELQKLYLKAIESKATPVAAE